MLLKNRVVKIAEILIIFIGLPVLYKCNYIPFHKSIPLFTVFLLYFVLLLFDKNFKRKKFGLNGFKGWRWILIRGLIFFISGSVIVYVFNREDFFIIPREHPFLWIAILLFYPICSAYTQELIYRAYFFHRFKELIRNKIVLIVFNAALFSFSHIIFNNWVAIVLSFFGSLLFSYTYIKSNSLFYASLEHAIFGNIIFTVGLGKYFYLPLGGN